MNKKVVKIPQTQRACGIYFWDEFWDALCITTGWFQKA
jgi:hypothetical protein